MRLFDNEDLKAHGHVEVTRPKFVSEVESVRIGPGAQIKKKFWDECFFDISKRLEKSGVSCVVVDDETPQRGSDSLLSYDSLGDSRELLPKNFTAFKRSLGPLPSVSSGTPAFEACSSPLVFFEGDFRWKGGESAALTHWHHYVWNERGLDTYKQTRNGLLRCEDSAKISPWLACGALSPRWVLKSVRDYEEKFGANESTNAFIDELLWRDYFKHLATWAGPDYSSRQGLRPREWRHDRVLFRQWALGETGQPFIDAGLRELWWTGWMSNRLRQNTASYLAKTLGVDWTWGARWFAAHLIDEDPEVNWGNWAYIAGVGTDPRDRIFNPERQAEFYDPEGHYQGLWANRRAQL